MVTNIHSYSILSQLDFKGYKIYFDNIFNSRDSSAVKIVRFLQLVFMSWGLLTLKQVPFDFNSSNTEKKNA